MTIELVIHEVRGKKLFEGVVAAVPRVGELVVFRDANGNRSYKVTSVAWMHPFNTVSVLVVPEFDNRPVW